MSTRVVTRAERPNVEGLWEDVATTVWPEFLYHDRVCNENWHFLNEVFPDCQFFVQDDDAKQVVGWGNSIPFAWDGAAEHLPGGVDGVLELAMAQQRDGIAPTTLCALQAIVRLDQRGRGLSSVIVRAMRSIAAARGFADLVAPVRPTRKSEYPLIPMDRYMRWTRHDGLPFDPWLRVHARLGATLEREASTSMLVEGTVAEWESWTGMAFPESGEYTVPGALVPVRVDRSADRVRYVEPNVWMRHATAAP
jgi:hypothetical protein